MAVLAGAFLIHVRALNGAGDRGGREGPGGLGGSAEEEKQGRGAGKWCVPCKCGSRGRDPSDSAGLGAGEDVARLLVRRKSSVPLATTADCGWVRWMRRKHA